MSFLTWGAHWAVPATSPAAWGARGVLKRNGWRLEKDSVCSYGRKELTEAISSVLFDGAAEKSSSQAFRENDKAMHGLLTVKVYDDLGISGFACAIPGGIINLSFFVKPSNQEALVSPWPRRGNLPQCGDRVLPHGQRDWATVVRRTVSYGEAVVQAVCEDSRCRQFAADEIMKVDKRY